METEVQPLEERVAVIPDRITRKYAHSSSAGEYGVAYLIYTFEIPENFGVNEARALIGRELSCLRDEDGELPAGVKTNSYFWKDNGKSYVIGTFYCDKRQVRQLSKKLRRISFAEAPFPKDIVEAVGKTTDNQRSAVLPLVQPQELPVPYRALLDHYRKTAVKQ